MELSDLPLPVVLGRIARSRSVAHGGDVQPWPEMYAEGSDELKQWRGEYGDFGRKSRWPKISNGSSINAGYMVSDASESFALRAASHESQSQNQEETSWPKKKRPTSATSNRSTKSQSSMPSTVASPEPLHVDEMARLESIGVTHDEAHALIVVGNRTCEELVSSIVGLKNYEGVSDRVQGLIRENWKRLTA